MSSSLPSHAQCIAVHPNRSCALITWYRLPDRSALCSKPIALSTSPILAYSARAPPPGPPAVRPVSSPSSVPIPLRTSCCFRSSSCSASMVGGSICVSPSLLLTYSPSSFFTYPAASQCSAQKWCTSDESSSSSFFTSSSSSSPHAAVFDFPLPLPSPSLGDRAEVRGVRGVRGDLPGVLGVRGVRGVCCADHLSRGVVRWESPPALEFPGLDIGLALSSLGERTPHIVEWRCSPCFRSLHSLCAIHRTRATGGCDTPIAGLFSEVSLAAAVQRHCGEPMLS